MLNVHHRENVRFAIMMLTLCWVGLVVIFIYNVYTFASLVGFSAFFWHVKVFWGGILILALIVGIRANVDQLEQIQAMVKHDQESVTWVPERVKV